MKSKSLDSMRIRCEDNKNYLAIYTGRNVYRFQPDENKNIESLSVPEFMDLKITSKCNLSCPYCLTPETLISTLGGVSPIKDIKAGDKVLAYDNEEIISIDVVEVYNREYDDYIINILLDNNKELNITPNHKIFTTNRGWIKASEINILDDIVYI